MLPVVLTADVYLFMMLMLNQRAKLFNILFNSQATDWSIVATSETLQNNLLSYRQLTCFLHFYYAFLLDSNLNVR